MKKLTKIFTLIALFAMTSACSYDANFRSYVVAHRLSHSAQAPHYTEYVNKDTTLSEQDKVTFKSRVQAEGDMITEAEKLLGLRQ